MAVTKLGSNTGRVPADQLDGVTVHSITYAFIGQAAPAALLFLAGTKDESVPQQDARRYHQAASQPKEVRWYEAGYFLNCTAREDMMV